ncbi:hypothetical protein [Streptomyces cadmiisoli]|uniref:hypothetical protein n=1 Tax=Streptomyces cadmiisoli TaxID=2184053 RepID=UPI00365D5C88
MTGEFTSDRPQARAAALASEVEGYLIARAERDDARREADALCARLPWLTTGQAEDLRRHYIDQRLNVTCRILRNAIRRTEHLHQTYEARYASLRRTLLRRHAAASCAVLACTSAIGAALTALRP